jgi:muramidase (phage lysozyme)
MIYLSAPAVAALCGCSLVNAHKRMRAGHFGPVLRRAGRAYAALPGIEQRTGRQFGPEQVSRATAHRGRIIIIEEAA